LPNETKLNKLNLTIKTFRCVGQPVFKMNTDISNKKVKVEVLKYSSKNPEDLHINTEMEITKEDIGYAFIPILDSMEEYSSGSLNKTKAFDLVKSFVEKNKDILAGQMHKSYRKNKGVALVMYIQTNTNPFRPLLLVKYDVEATNEPNLFEIVGFDTKKKDVIAYGNFQYYDQFTEKQFNEFIKENGLVKTIEAEV